MAVASLKIGTRAGLGSELVVVSCDPLGKRCVCRCSACDATMVVGAEAVATGSVRCVCTPLSVAERARCGPASGIRAGHTTGGPGR